MEVKLLACLSLSFLCVHIFLPVKFKVKILTSTLIFAFPRRGSSLPWSVNLHWVTAFTPLHTVTVGLSQLPSSDFPRYPFIDQLVKVDKRLGWLSVALPPPTPAWTRGLGARRDSPDTRKVE